MDRRFNPFIKLFEDPKLTNFFEDITPSKDLPMGPATPEILSQFAPALSKNAVELAEVINSSSINTPLRLAHFLAQTAHESAKFTLTVENLNYSVSGLATVFSKYFPTEQLRQQYARKPEAIANRAYANRMGNGPESSGDGYRFRGRGFMQLTGKNSYRDYSAYAYGDDRVLRNPDMVASSPDSMLSAIWYWERNNLNKWADRDDVLAVSRAVNIGNPTSSATPNGMDDRRAQLVRIKKLLGIK